MAEWFKALVLKTSDGESRPWVRIPPLPPSRSPFTSYVNVLACLPPLVIVGWLWTGNAMHAHIGKVVLPLARQGAGNVLTPLGTCFAIAPRLFATAAHVTGPSDQGLVAIIGKADSLADYQDTTDLSATSVNLRIVNYNPVHDIAILELIGDGSVGFGYKLSGSDMVPPGSPVVSLGYPHADHGRLVLTQQSSMVGARVLLGAGSVKVKHTVLNTQTRPGQSGGPVFSADSRHVCAMIVGGYSPNGSGHPGVIIGGIDPQTLHQTTHAVSAEYITAMI